MNLFTHFKSGLIAFSLLINYSVFAQVTVTNTNTVEWYVQNVLLGANVTVSNITYNGSAANALSAQSDVGEFTNPGLQIGLGNGLVMGSGDVTMAAQNNLGSGSNIGGSGFDGNDAQLNTILGTSDFYDKCIIEFDFVPQGDTISFNYIFASEEYPEYVCSEFNDVFGFFLTGPNPGGGNYTNFNVARVPSSMNPLTFTTTPVAINTINPGFAGVYGESSSINCLFFGTDCDEGCTSLDPNYAAYNIYYVDNNSGTAYEYDGRTIALPAVAPVVCGNTYHIKLAIADTGDGLYDSGVFLEAGSFASNGISAAGATAPGDTVLCGTNLTMNFSAGPDPAPINFWNFGDGVGTSSLANPSYTYADTGYYQVMYVASTVSGACTSADTVYFDVNLIYPEQFNAQFNIPPIDPCDGVDSLLVDLAFTGTGADSLIWNMGTGDIFYNVDTIDYYYTTQGTYTITMTAFDLSCGNTQSFTETFDYINSFSLANATAPPDTSFCGPPPYDLDFTAASSTPYHFWDFGDGSGTSTQTNPSYTYTAPGAYNIMYVAIDSSTCNVADTVYFSVDISQAEVLSAEFNLPTVEPCTTPDSILVALSFTGTGADSLHWDMGNGTTYDDVTSVNYYYTTEGQYIITMQAWDFYCNVTDAVTDTVNFFTSYSEANAEVPEDIFLCTSPLNVDFSAGQNPPPNAFWDFGDGSGTSTQLNPTYTYGATGSYDVMFVAIDSSTCNIADTAYFNVTLEQAEVFSAELNFTPPPACGGETALVEAAFTGSGADSIVWDMGNGDTFNSNTISYVYTEPGTYVVSMTAYDQVCNNVETISDTVIFIGEVISEAVVPNVFTPNGDGENDLLKILGIDPTAGFHMVIYNRWGRKVFETDQNGEFWDGKLWSGIEASEGVYYFEVTYRDICTDEDKITTGHVNLIK
ncbi:MAG: choice-of-anchor L domain-containing protein [Flavobacteriales bacterium]|nr:choice-of-anchor L domain-containing protein [Flavobacteriales bacterium]MCB9195743.1 choice-of-anchor L domain-containing protein [Flavobacteriales bacterium]